MEENSIASPQPGLRIALVTETFPPEINGVAMTLGRLVDGLRRRGHFVHLVRPRQRRGEKPASGSLFEEVLVGGMPIPGYGELRFGLPAGARLARLWRQQRPDLVHVATEGPLGWSAIGAARRLHLPMTSGFHTNFHSYSGHYGLGWLKTAVSGYLRAFHNRTHATLVPTQPLARELGRAGYRNLAVVSRGVDIALFNPARRSAMLRAAWGVAGNQPVALYVGRLAPEKNISLVLDAFRAMRVRRPDARLLFVGDGPLRSRLAARCPDAIFAGMRSGEDLARHYASADIFLFPSLTETFGNVTAEALASGLGVVAYDRAAAAELIRDGDNGRCVPCGDAAAFRDAAVALVGGDAQALCAMRAKGAASVAQLDWDGVLDRFTETLTGVIAAQARGKFHQPERVVLAD